MSPNPAVRFIDERTGGAPLMRKVMRYVFPEHGSFLLGEIALYAFLVLIATGIYLALFFDPSLAETTYDGTYAPLRGLRMSEAYKSAIDLSFDDRTGLLMRQAHHWAAGVAFFVWVVLIFLAGSADRVYVVFDLSYEGQIWFYRVVVLIAPVAAFLVTRRICRELQRSDAIQAERERAEREAEHALVVRPPPAPAPAPAPAPKAS